MKEATVEQSLAGKYSKIKWEFEYRTWKIRSFTAHIRYAYLTGEAPEQSKARIYIFDRD